MTRREVRCQKSVCELVLGNQERCRIVDHRTQRFANLGAECCQFSMLLVGDVQTIFGRVKGRICVAVLAVAVSQLVHEDSSRTNAMSVSSAPLMHIALPKERTSSVEKLPWQDYMLSCTHPNPLQNSISRLDFGLQILTSEF